MPFSHQLLLFFLPASCSYSILLSLLDHFLKLPPEQPTLPIFPGDDLGLLAELYFKRLIFLLIALILGEECLECLYFLILFADGALDLGDQILLLPNPVNIHLISLKFYQKREFLGL